jgi:hypothetical protein
MPFVVPRSPNIVSMSVGHQVRAYWNTLVFRCPFSVLCRCLSATGLKRWYASEPVVRARFAFAFPSVPPPPDLNVPPVERYAHEGCINPCSYNIRWYTPRSRHTPVIDITKSPPRLSRPSISDRYYNTWLSNQYRRHRIPVRRAACQLIAVPTW